MTTKRNGRSINVVRDIQQERSSPYKKNGARKSAEMVARDAVSLPEDRVSRCLQTIELALRRSNKDEALAAVERAFSVEAENSFVSKTSHIEEIGLDDRVLGALHAHNIFTIGDLILCELATLYTLRGLRTIDINRLVLSVESHGFRFSDAEDDD